MKDMDRKARDKARHLARRNARRAKVAVILASIRREPPMQRQPQHGR